MSTDPENSGGDGGQETAAAGTIDLSGTYTLTNSAEVNTCAVTFSPFVSLTIAQTGDSLTGSLSYATGSSVPLWTGSIDSEAGTFSLTASLTSQSTAPTPGCQLTGTEEITGTSDPFQCESFLQTIQKISGDCDFFFGAGKTSCSDTVSLTCTRH